MKTIHIPQKNKVLNTFASSGISFVAIFGSRAQGREKKGSDYDFLIEFSPDKKPSLLDLVGVKQDLEEILKKPVDLITTGGINKLMKDEVYKTMKVIYDNR